MPTNDDISAIWGMYQQFFNNEKGRMDLLFQK